MSADSVAAINAYAMTRDELRRLVAESEADNGR